MHEGLKPCPFCGSGPAKPAGRFAQAAFSGVEVLFEAGFHYVWCGTCAARTLMSNSQEAAITAWNNRAQETPDD